MCVSACVCSTLYLWLLFVFSRHYNLKTTSEDDSNKQNERTKTRERERAKKDDGRHNRISFRFSTTRIHFISHFTFRSLVHTTFAVNFGLLYFVVAVAVKRRRRTKSGNGFVIPFSFDHIEQVIQHQTFRRNIFFFVLFCSFLFILCQVWHKRPAKVKIYIFLFGTASMRDARSLFIMCVCVRSAIDAVTHSLSMYKSSKYILCSWGTYERRQTLLKLYYII